MTYGPLARNAVLMIFASLSRYHCAIAGPAIPAFDRANTFALVM